MVSQISGLAITGYFNTKAPPVVAGSVVGLLYWYEGLADWVQLQIPPEVPLGTAFHLAPQWLNQSAEPMCGHIDLTITKPDGSQVVLSDVLNQDNWAAPGNGWAVQFEPITLGQAGTYKATATLSTMGQVLDDKILDVAIVPAVVKFYMPSKISGRAKYAPILQFDYHYVDFWNDITNEGNIAGTITLTWYDTINFIKGTATMTLEPGETKIWRVGAGKRIDFTRASPYTLTLIGGWVGDNIATITVRSSQLSYVEGSGWVDV